MYENFKVRTMTADDYDGVHALWMTIKGFAIRSIDDSKEGVEKFLKRNPTTSVVAEIDGFQGRRDGVEANGEGSERTCLRTEFVAFDGCR